MPAHTVNAEYDRLEAVRLHTPGIEVLSGGLAPDANLFLDATTVELYTRSTAGNADPAYRHDRSMGFCEYIAGLGYELVPASYDERWPAHFLTLADGAVRCMSLPMTRT